MSRPLPHVIINYCIQCRWMLRAAYFAQELLSTFPDLGEVSLRPAKGGVFRVEISYYDPGETSGLATPTGQSTIFHKVLWDRKTEGGFPEVKVLKQLVRDCIDPKRDLGHSDNHKKEAAKEPEPTPNVPVMASEAEETKGADVCVDCLP